jgi:hypothetical protein
LISRVSTGSVDLETINDLEQRYALEIQIGEFGQVPKQLFMSPHPQRLLPTSPDAGKRWNKLTSHNSRSS